MTAKTYEWLPLCGGEDLAFKFRFGSIRDYRAIRSWRTS